MLIIGTVNNGAAGQFKLPGKFGNRIIDSTPDVELAIEQALKSREPVTGIAVLAEANYFRLNKAEYFVPITLKIPGMQLADNGYAWRLSLVEGKKLIPSVTRTFSKRRDLIAFLDAYEPDAVEPKPLTTVITLYRGQAKVFETPPLTVKDDFVQTSGQLPVKLRVPLKSLPTGAYDCVVTVLDPASQKSASWRAPINVVS